MSIIKITKETIKTIKVTNRIKTLTKTKTTLKTGHTIHNIVLAEIKVFSKEAKVKNRESVLNSEILAPAKKDKGADFNTFQGEGEVEVKTTTKPTKKCAATSKIITANMATPVDSLMKIRIIRIVKIIHFKGANRYVLSFKKEIVDLGINAISLTNKAGATATELEANYAIFSEEDNATNKGVGKFWSVDDNFLKVFALIQ